MKLHITQGIDTAFIENADNHFEIAKILTSLANSDGGCLYIGVKSNGKIKGVYPKDALSKVTEIVTSYIKPTFLYTTEIIEDHLKLVVCIKIPIVAGVKYQAKLNEKEWEYFVRINDHSIVANKIIKRSWLEEKESSLSSSEMNLELEHFSKLIFTNQPITLSRLYKLENLPLDKVDKNLSILVSKKALNLTYDGNSINFSLKS